MRRNAVTMPILLLLGILALTACAPPAPTISQAQLPPIRPGTARVWFLRGSVTPWGAVQAFAPMIFVDGAPVAKIAVGTEFYRDFAPGTYRFTVQPYGLPTGQTTVLNVVPGTENYLQVDWVGSWTLGYPEAGWSFAPNTFAILSMEPQVAQAYLPTLAYLGER